MEMKNLDQEIIDLWNDGFYAVDISNKLNIGLTYVCAVLEKHLDNP